MLAHSTTTVLRAPQQMQLQQYILPTIGEIQTYFVFVVFTYD